MNECEILFYEVDFWEEFDQQEQTEKGFVVGNAEDILKKLYEYYGKDNIIRVNLSWDNGDDWDSGNLGLVTEKMLNRMVQRKRD